MEIPELVPLSIVPVLTILAPPPKLETDPKIAIAEAPPTPRVRVKMVPELLMPPPILPNWLTKIPVSPEIVP